MKNHVVIRNILDNKRGIIGHQVNCIGVMGGGLALQIRRMYPYAYEQYHQFYESGDLKLGVVLTVAVENDLCIANMAAQDGITDFKKILNKMVEDNVVIDLDSGVSVFAQSGVATDYDALTKCLRTVAELSRKLDLPLYLPFRLGCGLAGGDWKIVRKLIEENAPEATICVLPKDCNEYLDSEKE